MPKSSSGNNSAESTADIIGHLSEAISRVDTSRSIAQEENAVRPVRLRALRLLDHRARSEQELRDRLLDAEFPQASVDTVIADLVDSGLVDDRRFAEEWVRQRRTCRGKSRRVLREELRRKGISTADCDHALAVVSDDDEQELARHVAQDRARRIRTVPADRERKICPSPTDYRSIDTTGLSGWDVTADRSGRSRGEGHRIRQRSRRGVTPPRIIRKCCNYSKVLRKSRWAGSCQSTTASSLVSTPCSFWWGT